LVHDVFVEAYLSLKKYQGRAPFLHWLRKIATRVGYRYWKQQAKQRQRSAAPLQDWHKTTAPPEGQTAEEAATLVHSLLVRLPPRVNVTGRVMAAIRRSSYRVARVDSPMLVFAGAALAAAALVAIWALPAWDSVHDPLVALFKPLSLVLE
jgi:RNA polymerase sigma-70 factor (ECF subfamily)